MKPVLIVRTKEPLGIISIQMHTKQTTEKNL